MARPKRKAPTKKSGLDTNRNRTVLMIGQDYEFLDPPAMYGKPAATEAELRELWELTREYLIDCVIHGFPPDDPLSHYGDNAKPHYGERPWAFWRFDIGMDCFYRQPAWELEYLRENGLLTEEEARHFDAAPTN